MKAPSCTAARGCDLRRRGPSNRRLAPSALYVTRYGRFSPVDKLPRFLTSAAERLINLSCSRQEGKYCRTNSCYHAVVGYGRRAARYEIQRDTTRCKEIRRIRPHTEIFNDIQRGTTRDEEIQIYTKILYRNTNIGRETQRDTNRYKEMQINTTRYKEAERE